MNKFFGIAAFILFIGCAAEEEPVSSETSNCGQSSEIFSPEGYLLSNFGGLEISDYSVRDFHFVDDFKGFLIAYDNNEKRSVLLETEDGGLSWDITNLPSSGDLGVNLPNNLSMKNIIFKDDKIASLFTTTSVMYKTDNGGLTWSHTSTNVGIQHYIYNSDNLYASNYDNVIFVSKNDGESWSVLSEHPDLDFRSTKFSFTIIGDRIYALGDNDKIIVLNLEGEFIEEISPNIGSFNVIYPINDNSFIVESYDKMVITQNGGESFSTYYDGIGEIVSLISENEAIAIIQTGGSNGDGFYTCDEIAYTIDGGANWIQSGICSMNLRSSFKGVQTMSKDRSILFFRNCLFEIKRI